MDDAFRLRVTSYNIRAFKDDRAALRDVITTLAPDVLLLQEAPRHPLSGQRIARFAADLGMTWSDGRRGWMSTTMLASLRVQVHGCFHHNLKVLHGDEPRGYCLATVSLPLSPPVHVVSVHLSLRDDERPVHAADITAALPQDDVPAIIGGDLNETPEHGVWKVFGRNLHEVSADQLTFPSRGPDRRIDAIFASARLPFSRPTIELDPDLLVRATDHLPVTVDFNLSPDAKP